VRIAVETGASLVPVLSFGENDMFKQVKNEDGSFIRTFQKKTQQILGFTFPLFYGRGIFNCKLRYHHVNSSCSCLLK
jgi:2-acylglycerol O-acyltransferase 2